MPGKIFQVSDERVCFSVASIVVVRSISSRKLRERQLEMMSGRLSHGQLGISLTFPPFRHGVQIIAVLCCTSSFFGIGIFLPVSDLLDFVFRSVSFPPFLYTTPLSSPLFFQKGVELSKRGPLPPF